MNLNLLLKPHTNSADARTLHDENPVMYSSLCVTLRSVQKYH